MPTVVNYRREILIPTIADFRVVDPTRAGLANGSLAAFWEVVIRPESFIFMEGAIRLGRPAVAGVADEIRMAWEQVVDPPKWDLVKQFSGAAVAQVVELNGYRRTYGGMTPRKRRVGCEHWNMGQVFEPRPGP